MLDGIISQYGFLFQRYVFIDNVINHASMDLFFTYEGVDDVDINATNASEYLSMISISTDKYIQVKSGIVNMDCWAKVLGNWLLVDDYQNNSFTLVCENMLKFDPKNENTVDAVYKYFENGKDKKKNAIARKVNDKFFVNTDENHVKQIIRELSEKCIINVISMEGIIDDLNQKIIEIYCTDIKIYERAKQERCNRFVEYLMAGIDATIKKKKKYTLKFQDLIEIAWRVKAEISDNKYIVDTNKIKKRKQNEAETLVKDSKVREIRQLRLVRNNPEFITREIVYELLYKDFRDVYMDGGVEISNIEDIAYTNYQDTLLNFDSNPVAKDVFTQTTARAIYSSIMDNSPIYRQGCYVYLTGDKIEEHKQISWGNDDE